MRRLYIIILSLFLALPMFAQTATEVAQQFIAKVEKQTLSTDFTLTVTEDASQPFSYPGKVQMRDSRFVLDMFGTNASYDGKSFYMYSEDNNELTITDPSEEELLQANPILFAKSLLTQATIQFSASNKKTDCYSIDFVPSNKSLGISKFTLIVRKSDMTPVEIRVKESGKLTTIIFKNAKFATTIPSFVLSKEGAWVNDLR